jgi:L-asparaginase
VDVVSAMLGGDARAVESSLASGARGIVVQGFPGSGGVTPPMMDALRRVIAAEVPVVLTSRSPFGRSPALTGGGSGARDLVEAGAIPCPLLKAPKARLLLMCALAATRDPDALAAIFAPRDRAPG